MIKVKTNAVRILKCKKGEALIESLASFFMFDILLVAVTTMIVTSLRITENYIATAGTHQISANLEILEKAPAADGNLTISGDGIDDVIVIVERSPENDEDNFKAFYPKVS